MMSMASACAADTRDQTMQPVMEVAATETFWREWPKRRRKMNDDWHEECKAALVPKPYNASREYVPRIALREGYPLTSTPDCA